MPTSVPEAWQMFSSLFLTTAWEERVVLCLAIQSCPTLCDPMNCSSPGSSVHGDSPGKNGSPCPPPGDLPNPGIKPRSHTLQADSSPSEPWEGRVIIPILQKKKLSE